MVFNLQSRYENMVEMVMFNTQRTLLTPKVGKPELTFTCSARLIVLYICVKFCENILNCIYCYGVDTNDGSAVGGTDTQVSEGIKQYPRHCL